MQYPHGESIRKDIRLTKLGGTSLRIKHSVAFSVKAPTDGIKCELNLLKHSKRSK